MALAVVCAYSELRGGVGAGLLGEDPGGDFRELGLDELRMCVTSLEKFLFILSGMCSTRIFLSCTLLMDMYLIASMSGSRFCLSLFKLYT